MKEKELRKQVKKKKQYIIEEGIFHIYPDFPVLVNDHVNWCKAEDSMHFHYYMEIGYCTEGKGVLRSNHQVYQVEKDDIMITAGNILHSTQALEENTWGGMLYIDVEDLLKLFPGENVKKQLKVMQESFVDIVCLRGKEHPDILWIIHEIVRLYVEKKQNYKMQIIGLLYALLFKVYDAFYEEQDSQESVAELPILPAIEYIYDHYMEVIKVKDLAKCCHFSESYFRKVFMEMKGISPMDYVNSCRIRQSCKLLRNTTDSIRIISEKCGFLSVTTYERNFKQWMNMLPSQYREKWQKPGKKKKDTYEIKRVFYG